MQNQIDNIKPIKLFIDDQEIIINYKFFLTVIKIKFVIYL